MTEDEAKTKWCPFGRLHWKGTAVNRAYDFETGQSHDPLEFTTTGCIASACMAWRWRHYWEEFTDKPAEPVKEDGGFCGLAGQP